MVALLKTTQIQEPSSATVNLTLDASGGVAVGQNLTVTGTTTFTGGSTFTGNATAAAFVPSGSTVPTNGLFLPAANSTGIATNSIERLRIDSSGNVGIGATGPVGRVDSVSNAYAAFVARSSSSGVGTSVVSLRCTDSGAAYFANAQYDALTHQWQTSGAERMRITANGGVSFGSSGTAYGTSGQYLQSNGDAAPTWSTLSASGGLIRAPRVLTSGTSYTTPAGCNNILIEMVGAGGGGGGATSAGTSSPSIGGGGGGGIYAVKYVSVTPSTTYTYAVGAGGAGGGTSANGTTGGTTSITIGATTYQITGGTGGTGSPAKGGSKSAGSTGTASNFDYTITPLNPASSYVGGGVDSPFGFSWGGNFQSPISSPSSGYAGKGWGAGGGAGVNSNYDGGPGLSGAAGVQGIIRIWEYT